MDLREGGARLQQQSIAGDCIIESLSLAAFIGQRVCPAVLVSLLLTGLGERLIP